MMEYVSIKHCDWFGSHYHGAEENETQDYFVRIEQLMTPALNRVLH